ncbi:hypothetical protein PC123_g16721 [Phytophthora cactorum]|nr:hypothetical protein PC123_g16721 [Phytophthora cactorum]
MQMSSTFWRVAVDVNDSASLQIGDFFREVEGRLKQRNVYAAVFRGGDPIPAPLRRRLRGASKHAGVASEHQLR